MGVPTPTTFDMRVFIVALAVFAIVHVAHAADAAKEGEMAPHIHGEKAIDAEKEGKKEMVEMDTNKDGKASLEEVQAFMKSRYYSKPEDTKDLHNDDGKPVSPDDITKMVAKDSQEFMDEVDKDKSGDLNLEEMIAQFKDGREYKDDMEDTPEGELLPGEEGHEGDVEGEGEDAPEQIPHEEGADGAEGN